MKELDGAAARFDAGTDDDQGGHPLLAPAILMLMTRSCTSGLISCRFVGSSARDVRKIPRTLRGLSDYLVVFCACEYSSGIFGRSLDFGEGVVSLPRV